MSDIITGAEVKPPIVEEKGKEPISEVAELKRLLEENNKKWQSKFDTVLTEKKTVESKQLTVEQRIQQIEQERQAERLDWARKEAKAKAQIDDELDEAIKMYSGVEAEQITKGASTIREIIDRVIAIKTEAAVKAAVEKIGTQPIPKGGKEIPSGNSKEALQAKYEEAVKNKDGDAMLYYKDQLSRLKRS